MRASGAQNPGVCPPAGSLLVPLAEVVTPSPSGKRFRSDTNGGHLHALFEAADGGNCNALRSEFSNPKDASGQWLTQEFNEKENDEAWYGVSVKWPTSGGFLDGWDSGGIFGIDTGNYQHHPSYGGALNFSPSGDRLLFTIQTGHCPSPGPGYTDSIHTNGVTDRNCDYLGPARCPNPASPPCFTANPNGYKEQETILGVGAPRPLELGVWHDFILHVVHKARSNGVLQIQHRVEGRAWELLYSNVPGDGALIQRAPHPTMPWNLQWGAPGDPGSYPASIHFQLYRRKPHSTQHLYQSGIRRRQSLAAIKSEFP
jgi:hypothetical protein